MGGKVILCVYILHLSLHPVIERVQVGDERPLTACAVSGDGSLLATAGWGSTVRVWGAAAAEERCVLRGHADRVVGVAWQPGCAQPGGSSGACLLEGGACASHARTHTLGSLCILDSPGLATSQAPRRCWPRRPWMRQPSCGACPPPLLQQRRGRACNVTTTLA